MSEKFDWDDECLVVPFHPAQNKTAVYTNLYGDIVLRQHDPDSWKDDEDNILIFRPENVEAIVRAIIEEAELPYVLVDTSDGNTGPTVQKKDSTAAERQRRRRAKLRERRDPNRDKSDAVTSVTAAHPPDRVQLALVRTAEEDKKDIQDTALTR
ncbi:hypothetical protein EI171_25995 [Bradyrhizobium sp. LCT2]|uniref:hypothetical protein n=1 Tax=Bradyrhizobium sp. LCT2 TaxID=2493093 RepID=UPI001373EA42|nr:hypothetical protein [Bradyrhizobium sp. LCT2]QHP70439.1 hypothetical protein EI171_25995 [Bradyrhizobium sp. LCT2]